MTNGLINLTTNKKSIEALSSRVGQLRNEIAVLEKITKKMLESKKLTEDEKDALDLLVAVSQDNGHGWKKWRSFKKQLQ